MFEKNVLIVDDDINVLRLLESTLNQSGFNVLKAASGESALEAFESNTIHVVILSAVLPGMDGYETLRHIRNHHIYHHVPVLMLAGSNEEIESVISLELGADDCIGKPIRYHELVARIKTILRRIEQNSQGYARKIILGGMELDLASRMVICGKQKLSFSYKEFELLSMLARNPGRVFTRDEFLDTVWKEEYSLETRTVDVHIRRIRSKLENAQHCSVNIETIRNVGYRLTVSS